MFTVDILMLILRPRLTCWRKDHLTGLLKRHVRAGVEILCSNAGYGDEIVQVTVPMLPSIALCRRVVILCLEPVVYSWLPCCFHRN